MLIAVLASVAGFAIDASSGDGELTTVFAALFVIGCLAAVLAVRQNGVFTAVIQPPLILFVLVPGAYFLMHSDSIQGLKDILINCGYPLIERFPLMFFTSAAVLLIGLARWYYGSTTRNAATDSGGREKARGGTATPGRLSALIGSLVGGRAVAKAAAATSAQPPRRRAAAKTAAAKSGAAKSGAARPARGDRRSSKPAPRRARPDETEIIEPVAADRPRRRRPRPDDMPPPDRRRRAAPAREARRPAPGDDRRMPYEREPRRSRYGGYEGYEVFGGADRYQDGYEPPRQRGSSTGAGTHHPVSRVRYRGGEDSDDRAERRPRRPRDHEPDRWEYDI